MIGFFIAIGFLNCSCSTAFATVTSIVIQSCAMQAEKLKNVLDIVGGWLAICYIQTSLPSRCKSSMTQGSAIGWNYSCAHGHLRVGGNRPQSINHPFLKSRRPGFGPFVIINVRRQELSQIGRASCRERV